MSTNIKPVDNSNTATALPEKKNIHVQMYANKISLSSVGNALLGMLSPKKIYKRALELRAIVKESKFRPDAAILSIIAHHARGCEDDHNRFAGWCEAYRDFTKLCNHIQNKPLHNQMRDDEMTELVLELTQKLINLNYSCNVMSSSAWALHEQLKKIGIKDVVAHDGTIVPIRKACEHTIDDCRVGRNKKPRSGRETSHRNAGKSHSCALKVHMSFSILFDSIAFFSITGGTGSESNELPLGLSDNLIILDRGYDCSRAMNNIVRSGNDYLVRLKGNHVYKVMEAFDKDGNELKLPPGGMKLKDVPEEWGFVDLTVCLGPRAPKDVRHVRVIRSEAVPAADNNENDKSKFMYLATSLSRDSLPSSVVEDLYVMRWGIEVEAFKGGLKSSNTLSYFNSANYNLIVQNILFSICAYSLKMSLVSEAAKKLQESLSRAKVEYYAKSTDSRLKMPHEVSVERACRYMDVTPVLRAISKDCSRQTLWRKIKQLAKRVAGPTDNFMRSRQISLRDYTEGKDMRVRLLRVAHLLFLHLLGRPKPLQLAPPA